MYCSMAKWMGAMLGMRMVYPALFISLVYSTRWGRFFSDMGLLLSPGLRLLLTNGGKKAAEAYFDGA